MVPVGVGQWCAYQPWRTADPVMTDAIEAKQAGPLLYRLSVMHGAQRGKCCASILGSQLDAMGLVDEATEDGIGDTVAVEVVMAVADG